VAILEVDPGKRRISLGLKQTMSNPWENVLKSATLWAPTIEGEIKNIGPSSVCSSVFEGDVDGMVHLSDLDWNQFRANRPSKDYKRGHDGRSGHRA
jgi:small subunit ribosomal protein S1